MKKIKMLAEFVKESDNSWKNFWWVVGAYIGIPAMIIHEGFHYLFIFLTGAKFKRGDWFFLRRNGNNLRYNFPTDLNGNHPYKIALIAIAPIFGMLSFAIACFLVPVKLADVIFTQWLIFQGMIFYYFINIHIFWLSDDDVNCVKVAWSRFKESKIYFFIKKIISTLAIWKKI